MSDARLREMERAAAANGNDPHLIDRLIVELGRSGLGPLASDAMKGFDEYVSHRLSEAKRRGAPERRDFELARRLLARFLHKHHATSMSRSGVCVSRLLGRRCTMASSSRCLCEALRDHWDMDHGDMWLRDGNVVAVTSQPYANHRDVRIDASAFAQHGLELVDLGKDASWYSPGDTTVLVVTASYALHGVKIIEIVRRPGAKRPLSITVSLNGRSFSLNDVSGRTIGSWKDITRRLSVQTLNDTPPSLPVFPVLKPSEWNFLLEEAMRRHRVDKT